MLNVTMNTERYPNATVEALGLLPIWVKEYIVGLTDDDNLKDHMDHAYGFGLYEFEGEVLENGDYHSPYEEDEDLQWIGKINTPDGLVYFYPYAITAIPTNNGYFLTRMD